MSHIYSTDSDEHKINTGEIEDPDIIDGIDYRDMIDDLDAARFNEEVHADQQAKDWGCEQ